MTAIKTINSIVLFLAIVIAGSVVTLEANGAGKVYAIICSDTAVWGGLNTYNHYNNFNTTDATYTSPEGNAARVMDFNYRDAIRDSMGRPVRFTWFMMAGSMYSYSLNSSRLLPLELMLDYHGDEVEYWGDEISFHYHTWEWSDPDGDSVYHWNQAPTFESCQADFEETVAAMIIERQVFFSTFRSGWNTMDNYWECYLDDFLPYRMESWPPYQRTETTEPIDNVYDWSRAPLEWVPYHPSPDDYQSPGSMRGWEVRCLHMNALSQDEVDSAFQAAHNGIDQVMNLWSHLPESDFPEQVERTHQKFLNAYFLYPDVEFLYCTGIEAMQRWRGLADLTPPEISLVMERNDPDRTFFININEEIYQPQPFVGVKMVDDSYATLTTQLIETNVWQSPYNIISQDIKGIAVGVCDDAGNPATVAYRINHFSQDTLPAIAILCPNSEVNTADISFTITGRSSSSYADSQLAIYYDNDDQGANGSLIVSGLPSNGNFAYQWDTSLVPQGDYFIYGVVNDGPNPPVVAYSQVPVTISHLTGDSLAPLSPLNLSADDSQPGRITLSWLAPGPAADGDLAYCYRIYRSLTFPVDISKNGNLRCAVPASQTSWTDEALPQDARFYYVVTSLDDAGNESAPSNQVSGHPAWVDNVPPLPITVLQVDSSVERELRLYWSQPGPAEDGDLPAAYKIYRASTSPLDFTEDSLVVATVAGATSFWADQAVQLGTTYYYIIRAQDDAGNLSLPSNEASGTAHLKPITFREVWCQIEGGFTQNSVRRLIYNRHTGHLLLTDVDECVIHIVDASDGEPLGRNLIQPAPGWDWLGPYGITIDDDGVIYVNQFAGNDAIYRWGDETSTPTIAIAPMHSGTDTRGIYVIGTGAQSRIFAVANDNICRIYATSDGHSYYLEADFATTSSAQHGIWVNPEGDEVYFTRIGTDPDYLQYWHKTLGVWQRDLNFWPTVNSVDSLFRSARYLFVANHGNSSIQALDTATGYKIGEYLLPGSSTYPSMGLFVDEPRQRIFWSRRGVGYGCVLYNPEELITAASLPWQLYQ